MRVGYVLRFFVEIYVKGYRVNIGIAVFKAITNCVGYSLAKMPHWLFLGHIKVLALLMRIFDRRRFKDAKANLDFVYGESMNEVDKKALIRTC